MVGIGPGTLLGGGTVNRLPTARELRRLGLNPRRITQIALMNQRHGHRICRLEYGEQSFVLKWLAESRHGDEVRAYALLREHSVPTLPVYGWTENALLLEDLSTSPTWRLAEEGDVECPETGVAVAEWYRMLHAAGHKIVNDAEGPPGFLEREADALSPTNVLVIGRRLGLTFNPVWQLASEHIEALKVAMRSLSETLNYNDFHWTNLALSRRGVPRLVAIVYDYGLLGIGPRFSDCRNVTGSLGERARAAFWEAYGPVDERECILDEPVSVLYSLWHAVQQPRFPTWADGLVKVVRCGELEAKIRRALEAA